MTNSDGGSSVAVLFSAFAMIVPGQWTMTRDGPRRIEDCDPERILSLEPSEPVRVRQVNLTEYAIVRACGYVLMLHPQGQVYCADGCWIPIEELHPGDRIKLAYPWQRDWQGVGDTSLGQATGEIFVDLALSNVHYRLDRRLRAIWEQAGRSFSLDELEQASSVFYRDFLRVVLRGGSAEFVNAPDPYIACVVPYGTEQTILRMLLRVGVPMSEQMGFLLCRGVRAIAAYHAFLRDEPIAPCAAWVPVTHIDRCDNAPLLAGMCPYRGIVDVNGIAVKYPA